MAKNIETTKNVPAKQNKNDKAQSIIDATVIADIPVELSSNLSLVARKLVAFLNYYSAASLTRLNTLNKFIQDAEERLYAVEVDKLDLKELNSRYREAKRAQAEIMTIARQVSQQAVDTDNTARLDNIYNLLKGMNSDTLAELQAILTDSSEEDNENED